LEVSEIKTKKQDIRLAGIGCETVAPSNLISGIKAADKRADAVRPRGDAFAESEKKPTDARR
jgi:hypothetical protein